MHQEDEEARAAFLEVQAAVTPILADTFQGVWSDTDATLMFFRTYTHGKARAEAFFLLLAHTLTRIWFADALLTLLRTPDSDVSTVLSLAEQLPLGWEKDGWGERVLNNLFLLWLLGTKVGREDAITTVILHLASLIRIDQALFALSHQQKVGKVFLKWIGYDGPKTKGVQIKALHELGGGVGSNSQGATEAVPAQG